MQNVEFCNYLVQLDVVGDLEVAIDAYSMADTWSLGLQESFPFRYQMEVSLLHLSHQI